MSIREKNFLTSESVTTRVSHIGTADRAEFVAEALRSLGHLRLRVHGESMLPALWPGDIVQIAACSLDDVRPGEIVLAMRDGRLFLHRMVNRVITDSFQLRGDSVPRPDPTYHRTALLGRLVCGSGAKIYPSATTLSRAIGVFLCHCSIARGLALKIHRRRNRSTHEFQTLVAR